MNDFAIVEFDAPEQNLLTISIFCSHVLCFDETDTLAISERIRNVFPTGWVTPEPRTNRKKPRASRGIVFYDVTTRPWDSYSVQLTDQSMWPWSDEYFHTDAVLARGVWPHDFPYWIEISPHNGRDHSMSDMRILARALVEPITP